MWDLIVNIFSKNLREVEQNILEPERSELKSRHIENSVPSGTIYSIYSLNLKNLFRMENDETPKIRELERQIRIEDSNNSEGIGVFEKNIRKLKEDRRKRRQKVDRFLASDEFARFAAQPFGNQDGEITRYNERDVIVYKPETINPTKDKGASFSYLMEDATPEEEELIINGHQFSVFRGNLKYDWLNGTTFKIHGKKETGDANSTYYIRLSKLGLLQIRKEKILAGESLIRVLESLLGHRKRNKFLNPASDSNENTSENSAKITSNILQIATDFAKRLNFALADNYKDVFGEEKIIPLEFDEIKNDYARIERQRYTLLLFTGLKDVKNNYIQPSVLHLKNPEVI